MASSAVSTDPDPTTLPPPFRDPRSQSQDSLCSEIESLSLSSLLLSLNVTDVDALTNPSANANPEDIAPTPPPPPPLGLEKYQHRWSGGMPAKPEIPTGSSSKRSIFTRFNIPSATLGRRKSRDEHFGKGSSLDRRRRSSSVDSDANVEGDSTRLLSEASEDSRASTSSSSDVTVIPNKKSGGSKTGTLARLRAKTGKSAEDLRKLFPSFYISSWGSGRTPSTPATPIVTSRASMRLSRQQQHSDSPGFRRRIRQELLLARSSSADGARGDGRRVQPALGGVSSSEDEEGDGDIRGKSKKNSDFGGHTHNQTE